MSERANFVIRRQPLKGSREEIVLSAVKAFYGKEYPEKVSLRLIDIFEPLAVMANGGNEQDIFRAIELSEMNIKDYFQQLRNQMPGYSFAKPLSARTLAEPRYQPDEPIIDYLDEDEDEIELEFD